MPHLPAFPLGRCSYPTPCWEQSIKSRSEKTDFCHHFRVSVYRTCPGQRTLGQCLAHGQVEQWAPLCRGTGAEKVWLGWDPSEQEQLFMMTACNHHRAAYSNGLIWIDRGSDIRSEGSRTSIQPLPATVIVFYHSRRLLFPGAKSWYFFITRAGKQGLVTGSGTNFCLFFF